MCHLDEFLNFMSYLICISQKIAKCLLLDGYFLGLEAVYSSKMLNFYQTKWCQKPEDATPPRPFFYIFYNMGFQLISYLKNFRPGWCENFNLCQKIQIVCGAHSASHPMDIEAFSLGKVAERKASSNVEVKNDSVPFWQYDKIEA